MEKEKYYITTPIYYLSGEPTLGTCCTTVYADVLARFNRQLGKDVFFLTGSDEHGQKVADKAKKQGLSCKEFLDKLDVVFKNLWNTLGISYDKYIRTTDDYHKKTVQKIFTKLYEKGDIYKANYEGLYCVPCESFFTQTQAVNGNCPDCGRPLIKANEEAYFFKASKYADRLKKYYEENPEFIKLDSTKKEMLSGYVNGNLKDVCVSRTSVEWGIKVPFDEKHTIYVWIDALPNYLSALGYLSEDETLFNKFWPADVHLMAKEIARFHLVIWPTILMALDLPLPKLVHAHGWLTKAGEKVGKSLGNGFNPMVLCERYGVDAVRYFLIKYGPILNDAPYDNNSFLKAFNSDLCNDLGNLLSRTCAMICQNFEGILPKITDKKELLDEIFIENILAMPEKVKMFNDKLEIHFAINEIWNIIRQANKYIDETAPWTLKSEENKDRLANVLHNLYFALYSIATMLKSFLPTTSEKMFESLGISNDKIENISREIYENLQGNKVIKTSMFLRLDIPKEIQYLEVDSVKEKELKEKKEEKMEEKVEEIQNNEITYDDFCKVKMVTGKILACEKVKNADKLLCSQVEIGKEVRQIVSGIAEFYTPEEMVGKTVVLVENLKPRKIKGIESKGMILCVESEGKLCVISPENKEFPSGLEVE